MNQSKGGEPPLGPGTSRQILPGRPEADRHHEADRERRIVIGVGASAGGLEALKQLFGAMPDLTGLAFVVVMHLDPARESRLVEILARSTRMEVRQAEDGIVAEPDTVYITPPHREITIRDGMLRLTEPNGSKRPHHLIDTFFSSLSAELGERAIALVLSGTGADGSRGVRVVKRAGGTVYVQDEADSVYPDMPRNAIATGSVDLVLPAGMMAASILGIAGSPPGIQRLPPSESLDDLLDRIFRTVKVRTGHDFSPYKMNTVVRRIERRMAANGITDIARYAALMEEDPQEASAFHRDMLIGVTNFFRDPEAFVTLRTKVFPRLFANRGLDAPVRIWHACCSTGEEVYSMAIMIREYLDEQGITAGVQFFATDIDEAAIDHARSGLYPESIEADLDPEKLRCFFVRTNDGYRIAKSIREMVVFAPHSLVKDPPFSRLDLLVCRNFLIYLKPEMQQRLLSLFHLALKQAGVLFLGSSETVGHATDLFGPIDTTWKIYERLHANRSGETAFLFSSTGARLVGGAIPCRPPVEEPSPGAVVEKLLMARYAPPCVVVNDKYEVVYVSTRSNDFLEVPVGEPTRDLLKMARKELRPVLRSAIHKSLAEQKQVVFKGLELPSGQGTERAAIVVEPVATLPTARKLAMVVFEQTPCQEAVPAPPDCAEAETGPDDSAKDRLIRQLEEQLHISHEQLQATIEQLETSNEGLMSTNEELLSINEEFQSTNEELHSTNEELETSREELQALNEELVTVNAELQQKVEELNKATSDLDNLLTSSEIATIFLDRGLRIQRFTPAMADILNLIPADIDRPLHHLAGKIDWPELDHDLEMVLTGEASIEREVTTLRGRRCFLARVLPYRTDKPSADGIVITLVDITERNVAEAALRESEERYRGLFEHMLEGFAYCRMIFEEGKPADFVYLTVNDAFETLTGLKGVVGRRVTEVIPGIRESDPELLEIYGRVALTGAPERFERFVQALRMWFSISIYSPRQEYFVVIFDVIDERKRAELRLNLLAATASALLRTDSPQEIVETLCREVMAFLDCQAFFNFLVEEPGGRLRLNACAGIPDEEKRKIEWLDFGVAVCGCAARDACRIVAENLADSSDPRTELVRSYGITAYACHPLMVRGEVLGTLSFGTRTRNRFTEDDLSLMKAVADHVAIAMERKLAEETVRKTAELRGLALEGAALGAWDYRFDTGEVVWDDVCRTMFGFKNSDHLSYAKTIARIHPDDRKAIDEALQLAIAGTNDGTYHREFRVVWPDGTVRWIASHGRVSYEGSGTKRRPVRFIGVNMDITERKQAEEVREQMTRLESLGLLAGGIAHDFNNILTAIVGNISLARARIGESHPAAEQLAASEKALANATGLTRQLLTFSRGGEPVRGPVDTGHLLREVVTFGLHGSNCKGKFDLPAGLWWLNADAGQINQTLHNMIINALHAMPDGGLLTITARNERIGNGDGASLPPGRYVKIEVADQGTGIPPEILPRIFDPYFTTKAEGSGLGLASVFSIVRRHGGAIDVASTPGRGTTFTIVLPAAEEADRATSDPPDDAPLPPRTAGGTILVMDDEEMIRSLAGAMLENLGYRSIACADGVEAVSLYRDALERGERFDAVVLDMTVPGGMGGREAAENILELDRTAVLVISSGYSVDSTYRGEKDPVFSGAVSKPYNLKQLSDELERLLK